MLSQKGPSFVGFSEYNTNGKSDELSIQEKEIVNCLSILQDTVIDKSADKFLIKLVVKKIYEAIEVIKFSGDRDDKLVEVLYIVSSINKDLQLIDNHEQKTELIRPLKKTVVAIFTAARSYATVSTQNTLIEIAEQIQI